MEEMGFAIDIPGTLVMQFVIVIVLCVVCVITLMKVTKMVRSAERNERYMEEMRDKLVRMEQNIERLQERNRMS